MYIYRDKLPAGAEAPLNHVDLNRHYCFLYIPSINRDRDLYAGTARSLKQHKASSEDSN